MKSSCSMADAPRRNANMPASTHTARSMAPEKSSVHRAISSKLIPSSHATPRPTLPIQHQLLAVDLQDLHARLLVRVRQLHLPVEASRAQQRRVQNVRPVRRGDHLDATVAAEAVHRVQQLQQRALQLVGALAVAAALQTDGVQLAIRRPLHSHLVDENDAASRARLLDLLLRESEAVAHDLLQTRQTRPREHPHRCAFAPESSPTA